MVDEHLKTQIHDVLRSTYFQGLDDSVDVSDGDDDDDIHVIVVSRKFDGKRLSEKEDLLWSLLTENLDPKVWGKISLSIGKSPAELKTI